MKILMILLALAICPAFAEDWTIKGKEYHNVKVTSVADDSVAVTYDGGAGHFALAYLPAELQKKFNYDPAKAKAIAAQKEEDAKPDWEKISDKLLVDWVDEVKQETKTAKISLDISHAQVQQGRLRMFSAFLENANLSNTSDPKIKKWIDCVMQNQICVGMPKLLVLLAWAQPDSDTTSTNGDGDDWETMNYEHFSSLVFLSGGIVKNITQTQHTNN